MTTFALEILKKVSARMAKLVDALVSGTSVRKDVQVRVLFRAQKTFNESQVIHNS